MNVCGLVRAKTNGDKKTIFIICHGQGIPVLHAMAAVQSLCFVEQTACWCLCSVRTGLWSCQFCCCVGLVRGNYVSQDK